VGVVHNSIKATAEKVSDKRIFADNLVSGYFGFFIIGLEIAH
jgi:hypothetical protein